MTVSDRCYWHGSGTTAADIASTGIRSFYAEDLGGVPVEFLQLPR